MSHEPAKQGYRRQRLERLVAEALEYELLPALDDPLLHDLHVLRVEVLGHLSGLHTIVAPGNDCEANRAEDIQKRLECSQARLRAELAAILRIKRMPTLRLTYVPLHARTDAKGGEA